MKNTKFSKELNGRRGQTDSKWTGERCGEKVSEEDRAEKDRGRGVNGAFGLSGRV